MLASSTLVFVSLADIAKSFTRLAAKGELWTHFSISGLEFLFGYGAAVGVGILLGVAMGIWRAFRTALDPWLSAFYSLPFVALAPVFIVAFGIGFFSKVVVVFAIALFPLIVNAATGVQSVDRNLVEVAKAFGATDAQVVRAILIPSALPFIISGMRLAVARGLIGVVVGELFGARAGLGYLILTAEQRFDTPTLYVAILILGAEGMLANAFLHWLEGCLSPWRGRQLPGE